MIFQKTHEKVMRRKKTQTRRLAHEDDHAQYAPDGSIVAVYTLVDDGSGLRQRLRYQVGKTYAVQPGRAKASIGQIRLKSIRREDARDISHDDVIAEGFDTKYEFLQTWTDMHDPYQGQWTMTTSHDPMQPEHCPVFLRAAAKEAYDVWVLEFELI